MNWHAEVAAEFTRLGKTADGGVVEEMAQHASAAFVAAQADGVTAAEAESHVRGLITSWCEGTSGPQRTERSPLQASRPASRSIGAGLELDVRHAWRLLLRQPGSAAVAIVMIALAIGATTTLFTVVNGVLLKPLSWPGADRLIRVTETRKVTSMEDVGTVSSVAYLEWLASPQTIESLGGWGNPRTLTFETGGRIGAAMTASVTASLFPLLRTAPVLGAGFTAEQEAAPSGLILSHAFWQEHFGGAPDVLGKAVTLEGDPYTVIGVMPRGFAFPNSDTQVWQPFQFPRQRGAVRMLNVIARLKSNATPAQAAAEVQARVRAAPPLGAVNAAMWGENATTRMTAVTMIDAVTSDVKPALWVMLAAVTLLFAAAAGNVANMQLARAMRRQKEIAVRTAIGAGTGRLTRQLLIETSILAAIGGVSGVAMTFLLLRVLQRLLPSDFPRADSIAVDSAALAVALGLTALVAVATGLMPTRVARLLNVNRLLADGGAAVGQSFRSPLARSRVVIITFQVAIAAVLLVGAALFTQSFAALLRVDRGFRPESVTTARVLLSGTAAPAAERSAVLNGVLDRLAALPNVAAVGAAEGLPTSKPRAGATSLSLGPGGKVVDMVSAHIRFVSRGYFAAVGMRIEGRGFDHTDTLDSEPVSVVNRAYASKFLKDGLNQRVQMGPDPDRRRERSRAVGIVDDIRQTATEIVKPEVYLCVCQAGNGPLPMQFVAIRAVGGAGPSPATIHQAVREVSPGAVVDQVRTLEAAARSDISRPRLYAALLGGFGVFALLVSVIGLYSGLSYGVTQRTQEIGVRAALGATPREIVMLVVKQGGAMTIAGLAIGLGGAAIGVRYLGTFLFGVAPYDLLSFSGVAITLVAAAMVACVVPAVRAARIEAIDALRHS
jgi:putative ABC transport system permease protein